MAEQKDTGLSGKPSFVSLFKNNRAPDVNANLQFVPYEGGEFSIQLEEIDSVETTYGHCLIGCVVGFPLNASAIKQIVKRWGSAVKFKMHDSGWIKFFFPSSTDRDNVLKGGPYMCFGRQLYLKTIPSCFLFREEDMFFLPSWVQFHGLPQDCWTPRVLSRIASVLGKLIHADKMTMFRGNDKYARVLIEMDASKERLSEFEVLLPTGEKALITFTYENNPKFCTTCFAFGHSASSCKGKMKVEEVGLMENSHRSRSRNVIGRNGSTRAKYRNQRSTDLAQSLNTSLPDSQVGKDSELHGKDSSVNRNVSMSLKETTSGSPAMENVSENSTEISNNASNELEVHVKDVQRCSDIEENDFQYEKEVPLYSSDSEYLIRNNKARKEIFSQNQVPIDVSHNGSCDDSCSSATEYFEVDAHSKKPKINGKIVWMKHGKIFWEKHCIRAGQRHRTASVDR